MENITIILPIHQMETELENYIKNYYDTIFKQIVSPAYLLVVSPSDEVLDLCQTLWDSSCKTQLIKLKNETSDSSFQGQLKLAVDYVKTDWFSISEFDDNYSINWFANVEKYMKQNPDVSCFLPLVANVDLNKRALFISNANPIMLGWGEKHMMVENEPLCRVTDFTMSGAVIRTETFKKVGGIKGNIKLSFNYEFLLRLTYSGYEVMVIPKVGYRHMIGRPGSLFVSYKDVIDEQQAAKWWEAALREYFFKIDREVTLI